MSALPPPPRHNSAPSTRVSTPSPDSTWKGRMKARGSLWGKKAGDKAIQVNDYLGPKVNTFAEKRFGTHAFWPVSDDFANEMDKAASILREFTVNGVVTEDKKTKSKILRKIPPSVLAQAKGLAIFTSMRSGIAPLGGAGGAGIVVGRLPDGSWSAPASISPQNIAAGFLIGIDVYDCVLVIRSQAALDSFGGHKVTLGTDIAVVAGPYGAGAVVEAGKDRLPVFSYVKSRGMYAGVEVMAQAFVSRFDENAKMYNWPGVKAKDILAGKVRVPLEAANLMEALHEAETGRAQVKRGPALDEPVNPELASEVVLEDGEVLKLPPTPDMTDGHEHESDPETETVIRRWSQPPRLPPRRGTRSVPTPSSPAHNPRRSEEADQLRMDGLVLGATPDEPAIVPMTRPPPLPPRSRDRPKSMLIASSSAALPLSPISPTTAKTVPSDEPPAYVESMRLAVPAPAPPLSPASSAGSVYDDDTPAELNLASLEPSADSTTDLHTFVPEHAVDSNVPEPSPALTHPGEKYSLGPSPSSTRLNSYTSSSGALVEPRAEAMSDAERREWEQHRENQQRADEVESLL